MIEELKKKFKERDRAISVLSNDGAFRAVAIRNTATAQMAQTTHSLPGMAAYFLAKTLTATTMLSIFLKGEERVIADIKCDGVLSKIYAEVLHLGECRGFVNFNENKDNSFEIKTLSDILNTGSLQISQILYNKIEPVVGIVPLQNGDIEASFAYYFAQSEQVNTAIMLDVELAGENIVCSGGLMVQAMPGANTIEIDKRIYHLKRLQKAIAQSVSTHPVLNGITARGCTLCNEIKTTASLEDLLKKLLPFEFQVLKSKQVDFFCRCNIDKYKSHLLMLSADELQSMKECGQNELVCQFCGKKYYLTDADFEAMIGQKLAEKN